MMDDNWDDELADGGAGQKSNTGQDSGANSWKPEAASAADSSSGGWAPQQSSSNAEESNTWQPSGSSYESNGQCKPRGGRGGRSYDNDSRGGRGGRSYNNDSEDGGGRTWQQRGRGGRSYNNEHDDRGEYKPRGGRSYDNNSDSRGDWKSRGGRGRGSYNNDSGSGGGWQSGGGDSGSGSWKPQGAQDDNDSYNNASGGDNGGERRFGSRGGRGRGSGNRRFGEDDGEGSGRGGGRQGRSYNEDGEGGKGEEGEEKRQPLYIPNDPTDDEETLYATIPSGIHFDKYEQIEVKVSGENVPKNITSFEESGLRQYLLDNVKKCKYLKPTPVQKYALPIIMNKRDIMACAQTGSGKTAAFLLPIVENLMGGEVESASMKTVQEPYAVIMAPTRELALQTFTEARKFTCGTIIQTCVAYGGVSVGYQLRRLEAGCHILVATPGRMMDFVDRGKLSFQKLKYLVLDEADRMLDQGFREQVERVATLSSESREDERVTLMFSATFPEEIQQLSRKILKADYIFLAVGVVGGANTDVEQVIIKTARNEKREKLLEILEQGSDRVLVFVETQRTTDFLSSYLCQKGLETTSIHGARYQEQREAALNDFKSGKMKILVATSVAARGLDIKDVKRVINYDMPKVIDEYVHRIGRTGRVGNPGKATSFYDSDNDRQIAGDLLRILTNAQQEVPDWLESESSGGGYGSSFPRPVFGGSDIRNFRNEREVTHVDSGEHWDQNAGAPAAGADDGEEIWE